MVSAHSLCPRGDLAHTSLSRNSVKAEAMLVFSTLSPSPCPLSENLTRVQHLTHKVTAEAVGVGNNFKKRNCVKGRREIRGYFLKTCLFSAVAGLPGCQRAFSRCSKQGLLCGLLTVVDSLAEATWASVVVAQGLSSHDLQALEHWLSNCGTQA